MSARTVSSVVLAGGGTAGHVNPLLAVADELRAREPGAKVLVLGTTTGLEADLVPARGYELRPVPRVPLPRRPSVDLLTLPGKLGAAVKAAEAAIDEIGAQAVVGFGGYVSTPAYLAARRRGVPVVIHEQNARPGLANKLGARWAARVGVTFEGTPLRGGVVTGLPLRREIAELVERRESDAAGTRVAAADVLGLDPTKPTLLVTGGSSGALSVNTAVVGAAADLLAAGIQVLHLTGRGKDGPVREALTRLDPLADADLYHVREYLPEMHHALAVADLVVARSGAGTVCELAALGIPAVYVPLPVGNGEQRLNATPLVRAGGGVLVDDADLTPAWVAAQVPALLRDADGLATMAAAARATGVRDAAARVADLVEQAVAEAGR
ncbi:UDP-N-acetylglucosamine--N-acetylmuramyl- (pentapeptide) pyrophosphoryl-undecaprenol N- acetylglucosamine transferase [Xylanimonas cellulosilytica DSM 15894]|uniref:UDP-N-acetylglucosamine--N-acetylmuramyl-(pentapeptide) pyrophosphoryl-undecaprenol N-acetylglucosamine transferase n=1 Tax=Xylanimonas cellulosilytica (strain DSM 15894 / JCM 12276 / CECT 5975 / KCTC 9989 / LMG 20990 / NBRC 107835 / XIL07) TaxID=446471 RepID=D1C0C6_XYLCX|nr:undecaprenyldiphospho-muramoylpentapeptide beta-N-acetylglucosaminyltransferase [Xylanimonas cellulosilytica]ACZ30315.1 UDP-N-acetylglucosamine--N-acetylmuramyl- (pentapeptide) pyrophosphoryl-undecaprenol N- acetylglucosamine transferase [Xylanimonas cellulosilytica DSM 15894]